MTSIMTVSYSVNFDLKKILDLYLFYVIVKSFHFRTTRKTAPQVNGFLIKNKQEGTSWFKTDHELITFILLNLLTTTNRD